MLTSKQRSRLKSLASNISPIGQVGKGGINENMLSGLAENLETRELIKINVLANADDEVRTIGEELAKALKAEIVIVIGRKVVLYRRSKRVDVDHIEI